MQLLSTYQKLTLVPGGRLLFSRMAAMKAPYFSTIRPLVQDLSATRCVIFVPKRRQVLNHIGTMHAIAMCNACEMAFGLTIEAGLPRDLRWIPKGMTVRYLKKGETDLTATCDFPKTPNLTPGDHVVPVKVTDKNDVVVMEADITVYVSKRT
jgi:acyl-coenzyme A thioesterase PaaI-like protein